MSVFVLFTALAFIRNFIVIFKISCYVLRYVYYVYDIEACNK